MLQTENLSVLGKELEDKLQSWLTQLHGYAIRPFQTRDITPLKRHKGLCSLNSAFIYTP